MKPSETYYFMSRREAEDFFLDPTLASLEDITWKENYAIMNENTEKELLIYWPPDLPCFNPEVQQKVLFSWNWENNSPVKGSTHIISDYVFYGFDYYQSLIPVEEGDFEQDYFYEYVNSPLPLKGKRYQPKVWIEVSLKELYTLISQRENVYIRFWEIPSTPYCDIKRGVTVFDLKEYISNTYILDENLSFVEVLQWKACLLKQTWVNLEELQVRLDRELEK